MELSILDRTMLLSMGSYSFIKMIILIVIAIRGAYALDVNDRAYANILKDKSCSRFDAKHNGERHPIILMAIGATVVLIYSEMSMMAGYVSMFIGEDKLITYFTKIDMMNHMISDTGWTLMLFVVWWSIGHFIREDKCHTE